MLDLCFVDSSDRVYLCGIRYPSVHKTSLAILKRIDRFVRLHNRQPVRDLDVTTLFPQLVCMRVTEYQRQTIPRKFTYWLDIFRPMSFSDIHHLFDAESRIVIKTRVIPSTSASIKR
jgi:hypothetical protein